MAEGGLLAWKIQKLKSRGPVVSYSKEALALPDPPEGKKWSQNDDTREWTLIDDDDEETTAAAVIAAPVLAPTTATKNDDVATTVVTTSLDDAKPTINNPPSSFSSPRSGVDYVEHTTLPTDTLPGLCIAYKTTAQKIRQANGFSGDNLLLAPSTLVIPLNRKEWAEGRIRLQDKTSKEFKRQAFIEAVKGMGSREADAYLDMADGNLERAINDALEDREWERKERRRTTGGSSSLTKNSGGRWIKRGLPLDTSIHEAIPIYHSSVVNDLSPKVYNGAKKEKELEMRRLL